MRPGKHATNNMQLNEVISVMLDYLDEKTTMNIFGECCDNIGVSHHKFSYTHLPDLIYEMVNLEILSANLKNNDLRSLCEKLTKLSNKKIGNSVNIYFSW